MLNSLIASSLILLALGLLAVVVGTCGWVVVVTLRK